MAEKKFGNRLFKVDQPLATQAIVMQGRLLRLIGPASDKLPALFDPANRKGPADQTAALRIMGVLVEVFGHTEPEATAALLGDIVKMAQVKGANGRYEQADIDTEFSSDPGELYAVVAWILRETLGPFFSGLVANGSLKNVVAA
ncbi:phage tail assembly chaperone [Aureimonas flava]|uniref:phage tail assembly chaperone n=1 Tax=Aureimonas flava TaxID=2320271 RepID=UPI0010A9674A|nr:hypothetical protein [Aureimonas flava]